MLPELHTKAFIDVPYFHNQSSILCMYTIGTVTCMALLFVLFALSLPSSLSPCLTAASSMPQSLAYDRTSPSYSLKNSTSVALSTGLMCSGTVLRWRRWWSTVRGWGSVSEEARGHHGVA